MPRVLLHPAALYSILHQTTSIYRFGAMDVAEPYLSTQRSLISYVSKFGPEVFGFGSKRHPPTGKPLHKVGGETNKNKTKTKIANPLN